MFKEIQVTDSFLGINEMDRGCQAQEMYDDCIKDSYIDTIRNSCGCAPFSLKLNKNVHFLHLSNLYQPNFRILFAQNGMMKDVF